VSQRSLALALLLSALVPASARSETLNVAFSGTVTSINLPALEAFFEVGDPLVGFLRVELTTPDSDPLPTFGSYEGASDFRFEIGGTVLAADTGFAEVGDGDAFGGGTADFFRGAVLCEPATPCAAPPLGGFAPTSLELVLADPSDAVFSDDSLPASLALAAFPDRSAVVAFEDGVAGGLVEASVDALTTSVPEPAAPLLACVGAAALLAARRRAGGLNARCTRAP
jgi:hypothetical protein